jgi:GGDEF domain-containing protein
VIDRVKIYRFEPDESGEVVAESIDRDRLPALLGLHFPASDIPISARDLFSRVRQRVIVDVAAQRKTSHHLDSLETGESLPTVDIRYAPVQGCHVEYLLALGVQASLSVPIFHQRQFWGLLVVHHTQPRRFSQRELQVVQLLVDQLSLAIAVLDLDRFKVVNETFSHAIGDLMLRRVSDRLKKCLQPGDFFARWSGDEFTLLFSQLSRAEDVAIQGLVKRPADLVARYDGEEFAIILPNTLPEGAVQIAEAIRKQILTLALPHITALSRKQVTLSLGVATVVPTTDCTPFNLIAAADQALYQSKNAGRDRVVYRAIEGIRR